MNAFAPRNISVFLNHRETRIFLNVAGLNRTKLFTMSRINDAAM